MRTYIVETRTVETRAIRVSAETREDAIASVDVGEGVAIGCTTETDPPDKWVVYEEDSPANGDVTLTREEAAALLDVARSLKNPSRSYLGSTRYAQVRAALDRAKEKLAGETR